MNDIYDWHEQVMQNESAKDEESLCPNSTNDYAEELQQLKS